MHLIGFKKLKKKKNYISDITCLGIGVDIKY